MNDTLPDIIDTDSPADGATLRPSQLRRVEALKVARQILEIKPGIFTGSKLESARSVVVDLMTLADWILLGPDNSDPFDVLTVSHGADGGFPPHDDLGPYPDENNGPGNP